MKNTLNYEEYADLMETYTEEAYNQGLLKTYLNLSHSQKSWLKKHRETREDLETNLVELWAEARANSLVDYVENYYDDNR